MKVGRLSQFEISRQIDFRIGLTATPVTSAAPRQFQAPMTDNRHLLSSAGIYVRAYVGPTSATLRWMAIRSRNKNTESCRHKQADTGKNVVVRLSNTCLRSSATSHELPWRRPTPAFDGLVALYYVTTSPKATIIACKPSEPFSANECKAIAIEMVNAISNNKELRGAYIQTWILGSLCP